MIIIVFFNKISRELNYQRKSSEFHVIDFVISFMCTYQRILNKQRFSKPRKFTLTIIAAVTSAHRARLAQSVEHETLNLRVVGSSPTLGVGYFFFLNELNLNAVPVGFHSSK